MNKAELLEGIRYLAKSKLLKKDEILDAFERGVMDEAEKHHRFANVLYYLGGGIVVLGIIILLWQNWDVFNFVTKILVTFGAALAAYFVGLIFERNLKNNQIAEAFYFIYALILPTGIGYCFYYFGYNLNSYLFQTIIYGILCIGLGANYFITKRNLFLVFLIGYATAFFLALSSLFLMNPEAILYWHIYEYRVLMIGLSYILFGYAFKPTSRVALSEPLYAFGVVMVLAAGLMLGGFKPDHNWVWEVLYPFLAFAVLGLSVYLKSKSFLVFGSLAIMVYILKITSEYFTNEIGWPSAIIFAGLVLIGVGYGTVFLNKKYFDQI